MSRKLSFEEFVLRAQSVHGDRYDYSAVEYKDNKTKVRILCPEHGEFLQDPSNHFAGKGCPACAGRVSRDQTSFLKKAVSIHGDCYDYSLVSYTRSDTPVTILCREHGEFEQTPASHLTGSGCPVCSGKLRLTAEEFINRALKVHGDRYSYDLAVYVNQKTKVQIVCPDHGAWWQLPTNHLAGKGCPSCANNKKLDTQSFIGKAQKVHGDVYSYQHVSYTRSNRLVTIVCPLHGPFQQTPNNHLSGNGCPQCGNIRGGQALALTTFDFVRQAKEVHGDAYDYSLVKYERSGDKVGITCATHGTFFQSPEKHLAGQGCPKCAKTGPSSGQEEVAEFLSGYTTTVLEIPMPEELSRVDIVLPEHALAVEYHGLIWHSSKFLDDPRKDFKKHKRLEDLGIRTIHIYEDEWKKRRGVVQDLLLAAIGKLPKIGARQTKVVSVSSAVASSFYDEHHIQGGRRSQINFGLVRGDELLACMSFDRLRSERTNDDPRAWELVRFATKGVAIRGGPSKLLKAFLDMGVASTLTSYSDNRLFTGDMYKALGFTLTHETAPDYYYTTGRIEFGRKHKSRFQKKYLPGFFPGCDLTKTEWEICEANGLYRIYDCGKKRWDLVIG